jgi:hypothetical protein
MRKNLQRRKESGRYNARSRAQALQLQKVQSYRERQARNCAIDMLLEEYFKGGIIKVRWSHHQIRDAIDQQYAYALRMANDVLIRWPAERKQIDRLFSDLALIKHLLRRNKELNDHVLGCWIGNLEVGKHFFQSTMEFLEILEKFIDRHEESFQLQANDNLFQRNFDPFTFFFIEGIFYGVWCKLRQLKNRGLKFPLPPRADLPLFTKFLSAVWRDLGLPVQDHRGRSREPLQEWLADRVRKRFRNLDNTET